MRGDVLLYRSGGSLKDRVVCAFTRGPYCHCEVDLGDGSAIGARSEDGISRHPRDQFDRVVAIPMGERATPERIEAGIAWLMERVGEPFSWAAVADHVLPGWLATALFGRECLYSCGNLIAMYMVIVGGLEVDDGMRSPMRLSPNDIARAIGLLKSHASVRLRARFARAKRP